MIRIFVLLFITSFIQGCWVYLSPTTYLCKDTDAVYKYRKLPPGGKGGMTMHEVIQDFKATGSDLLLNNEAPNELYFLHNECPIWKYTFKNNHLIKRGYLVMEGGVWSYSERDYTVPKSYQVPVFDENKNIIRKRAIRIEPIFNENNDLIDVLTIEDGEIKVGK